MATQHTPGPWGTDRSEHDHPYQDIVVRAGTRTICRVWIDDAPVHDYNAAQLANASLIAAAPDLLEVLQEICDCPQWVDEATVPKSGIEAAPQQVVLNMSVALMRMRKARAAIAKATGGAA